MKNSLLVGMLATTMAAALITGCGSQSAAEKASEEAVNQTEDVAVETEDTAVDNENAAVETEDAREQDAEALAEESAELVTIEDIYAVNGLPEIFANHKTLTIDYQSKDADGNILGTSTSQIILEDDGNVKYEASMDNGEDVYKIQAAQYGGLQYTLNETTGEGTVGFCHSEFYLSYVQDTAYLPLYTTYTYSNIENSNQDDALVVSADIDDVGKVYMYVNPENKDLYALEYDFSSGVTTNYSITYDNPVDLGVTCLEDALAKGTTTLTVNYMNSDYTEETDYEVPANTQVYEISRMFDLYSSKDCADDSYQPVIEIGNDPVTIYAVGVN